ncbi:hypothetical protein SDC9_139028 [bioreactor metagenome]|uniref:Uncharacterized protein n=1 Tax=bioreactor metagenome TaxID=1076179 RepID=A0A645DR07_9ZZZZ
MGLIPQRNRGPDALRLPHESTRLLVIPVKRIARRSNGRLHLKPDAQVAMPGGGEPDAESRVGPPAKTKGLKSQSTGTQHLQQLRPVREDMLDPGRPLRYRPRKLKGDTLGRYQPGQGRAGRAAVRQVHCADRR